MYKKDGTINDRYNSAHNPIPFCVQDFQEIFLASTKQEDQINIGRLSCQAMCEIALTFMQEIAARPISLKENESVPPSLLLERVKIKFPELSNEATSLYEKHLEKWQLQEMEEEMNIEGSSNSSSSPENKTEPIDAACSGIRTRSASRRRI